MMDCKDFEAHLVDWLEGQLASELTAELEAHIRGCEACSRSFAGAKEGMQWVRLGVPLFAPPASLDQKILAHAQAALVQRTSAERAEEAVLSERGFLPWLERLMSAPSLRPALAFCAVVMVVGSFYFYQYKHQKQLFLKPSKQGLSALKELPPSRGVLPMRRAMRAAPHVTLRVGVTKRRPQLRWQVPKRRLAVSGKKEVLTGLLGGRARRKRARRRRHRRYLRRSRGGLELGDALVSRGGRPAVPSAALQARPRPARRASMFAPPPPPIVRRPVRISPEDSSRVLPVPPRRTRSPQKSLGRLVQRPRAPSLGQGGVQSSPSERKYARQQRTARPLQEALARRYRRYRTLIQQADHAYSRGQVNFALVRYGQALSLAPSTQRVRILWRMGVLSLRKRTLNRADALLQAFLRETPAGQRPQAYLRVVKLYHGRGYRARAVRTLEQLRKRYPAHAHRFRLLLQQLRPKRR